MRTEEGRDVGSDERRGEVLARDGRKWWGVMLTKLTVHSTRAGNVERGRRGRGEWGVRVVPVRSTKGKSGEVGRGEREGGSEMESVVDGL